MKNPNFMIFSPTGEKPHTTLAVMVTEDGRALAIIEGRNGDLLKCFASIVSGLVHKCKIPLSMVTTAFTKGAMLDTGEEVEEDDE